MSSLRWTKGADRGRWRAVGQRAVYLAVRHGTSWSLAVYKLAVIDGDTFAGQEIDRANDIATLALAKDAADRFENDPSSLRQCVSAAYTAESDRRRASYDARIAGVS